ncbi:MAG: hypothetical protein PF436_03845 [Prolixibacteraceae bacterium]|jgi:hypothetical protein|nr:hypothetical protein [Prolixibacteraceae bacterium]
MKKYIAIVLLFASFSCANQKASNQQTMSNEPFIIYKTRVDYTQNVPVILNAGKTAIVSYPGPSDLITNNELLTPTQLANGYLLDNRGISPNVAFTSYTYSDYVKLEKAPSIEELFESIIDKYPLINMYDCKNQLHIKNDKKKIKHLIKSGFNDCKKLK